MTKPTPINPQIRDKARFGGLECKLGNSMIQLHKGRLANQAWVLP